MINNSIVDTRTIDYYPICKYCKNIVILYKDYWVHGSSTAAERCQQIRQGVLPFSPESELG